MNEVKRQEMNRMTMKADSFDISIIESDSGDKMMIDLQGGNLDSSCVAMLDGGLSEYSLATIIILSYS
jgi:hypothetical protein